MFFRMLRDMRAGTFKRPRRVVAVGAATVVLSGVVVSAVRQPKPINPTPTPNIAAAPIGADWATVSTQGASIGQPANGLALHGSDSAVPDGSGLPMQWEFEIGSGYTISFREGEGQQIQTIVREPAPVRP
jgi:hypothetical protein